MVNPISRDNPPALDTKAIAAESENAQPEKLAASVLVIYLLMTSGLFFGWLALLGGLMAYLMRIGATDNNRTHYTFQIRTFWVHLCVGAMILKLIINTPLLDFGAVMGFSAEEVRQLAIAQHKVRTIFVAIMVTLVAWVTIRYGRGIYLAARSRPHPHPNSPLW